MLCEAAHPPEKTVKTRIKATNTGFRPKISLILANMTMTAGDPVLIESGFQ